MIIREAVREDVQVWSEFRTRLWPNTGDSHIAEIEAYFRGDSIDIEQVFIAENDSGEALGFLEINIREFAEGSRHPKIPYVEAWYIDPPFQGKGHGGKLMAAAETWAREKGFSELASDTELENKKSISIHKNLGFEEKIRVVCFLKSIR